MYAMTVRQLVFSGINYANKLIIQGDFGETLETIENVMLYGPYESYEVCWIDLGYENNEVTVTLTIK